MYDFLLVVYSNFCRITHRFWGIWCKTVQWPWNIPNVIDCRITWKLSCGHVCKMFGRQWTNEPKIAILTTPFSIDAPSPANPREYLHKPYTVRNYVPCATFLSLTVYGYLCKCSNTRRGRSRGCACHRPPKFGGSVPKTRIQGEHSITSNFWKGPKPDPLKSPRPVGNHWSLSHYFV